MIQEKEKLYVELRKILARQPGPEVSEQLGLYAKTLKEKTHQMQSMTSELQMYQVRQLSTHGCIHLITRFHFTLTKHLILEHLYGGVDWCSHYMLILFLAYNVSDLHDVIYHDDLPNDWQIRTRFLIGREKSGISSILHIPKP